MTFRKKQKYFLNDNNKKVNESMKTWPWWKQEMILLIR